MDSAHGRSSPHTALRDSQLALSALSRTSTQVQDMQRMLEALSFHQQAGALTDTYLRPGESLVRLRSDLAAHHAQLASR